MSQPAAAQFDSRRFLKSLTSAPGVYRMLDEEGTIIYVGKASNLRNRVGSYFHSSLPPKTAAMMRQMCSVEVTVTHTETEALLLENNLIKRYRPRYNVLLRDDKSYPYIRLEEGHQFARLSFYRGRRREKDRFFGPYPSAGAVRETLHHLQKLFLLRSCNDTFFKNRSRPCLQYQIQRCSAPCVGFIDEATYRRDVENAVLFLEGKNQQVITRLVARMEAASEALDFEQAARLRDQISRLQQAQEHQYVSAPHGNGDVDVIAAGSSGRLGCVTLVAIRGGRNLGSKTFFPRTHGEAEPTEILQAFLPQYYLGRDAPHRIICNLPVDEREVLEATLTEQTGHRVAIGHQVRGERRRWLEMAGTNLKQALATRLAIDADMAARLEQLQEALGLEQLPARLECFDISHTGGESTVASCVVFDSRGPLKSDYRRYNIEGVAPGDDYGAIHQAVRRRYQRIKKGEAPMPDVLFIDGGRGQLAEACSVLEDLQIEGLCVVGISKGPTRKPGLEKLWLSGRRQPLILPAESFGLHLIQRIRDEAHRFAIVGHRARRAKRRTESVLEEIPGLGPKRRQQLLKQFGGLQGIRRAGVGDLQRAPGISQALAQRIYDGFHGDI
ncbi:MAG TPA: excinuclease ABC subunit UvrC [Gammaproteobacteria bacterium]|nr:excinuclease ABC subunit UvrC [Gammaproteobacteria bacterium]